MRIECERKPHTFIIFAGVHITTVLVPYCCLLTIFYICLYVFSSFCLLPETLLCHWYRLIVLYCSYNVICICYLASNARWKVSLLCIDVLIADVVINIMLTWWNCGLMDHKVIPFAPSLSSQCSLWSNSIPSLKEFRQTMKEEKR
jgi:hypothetical protein